MLIFHLHTQLSNVPMIDSTTNYESYIKKAKEFGMKSICFTEHGNIYQHVKKRKFCEKKEINIKYIHGCEVYLTKSFDEKVQDNMHTILIAKNLEGFHELNKLVSLSNDPDHFYYRPRLSFEEFVNISPNIITTSACLASPLNRLQEDDPWIDKLVNRYDFLEVQYHNIPDQLEYNERLFGYAEKYNKRLVAGTDTHSLDKYEAECRYILKKAKKSTYGDEDKFDLTFKNREQVKEMFEIQGSLSAEQIEEALDSTDIIDDMVEKYELDKSFKYPNDLYEDVHKEFKDRIDKGFAEKLATGVIDKKYENAYRKRIEEEYRAYKKMGMEGFMSFMSELMTWCWDNNIPTGPARGSCAGSLIAYIINITDLDAIKWKTVFSRFVNEDRISLGDIDVDFDPEDKTRVYNYIIERYGVGKTCYIATFPTIKELGAIQEICRGLEIPYGDVEAIKNLYKEDPEEAKSTYPNVFYYFEGLMGTIISRGKHPAGIVGSPVDLHSAIGVQYIKDKDTGENCIVSQIDMKEIDGLNFVKYDILSLKNVGIIKETCQLAGIPYPKSHTVDWEDKKVWKSLFDSPVGIFQFESKFGFESLKKFKAKSVEDMTLVTACIRPSGESYRDMVFDHKKNQENPTKEIDSLLEDSLGYLVYQEQQIAFLQEMCGFTGGQADTIRRAIGKFLAV